MKRTFSTFLLVASLAAGLSAQKQPAEAARSAAVRKEFMKKSGHPNGWTGHVVDHIVPLCAGGPDAVENMQWQRADVALQKDRYEKALCQAMKKQGLTMVKAESHQQ